MLSDQFPSAGNSNSSGGLINYSDFVSGGYRILCFDVSRLRDRLSDPNSAVSIQVQATRTGHTTACNYYYLVERLQALTMQFNASETKLVLGL